VKRVRRVGTRAAGRVCGGGRKGVKVERIICGDGVLVRCFVWARGVGMYEFHVGMLEDWTGVRK
jgi:hypothetical protein